MRTARPGGAEHGIPALVISTRVEVAFTRALAADGKEHLLEADLLAELASRDIPGGDDRLPVLVALSSDGRR